ncbi:hypothetical protein BMIN_1631 [Bifidobacterium minimum]|uniref:Uncharacterized protein n=1 Tax=Bifidobacterium minimum TaxID=1693 RepID=A0A087BIV6_9BIFI|nr:hypothetical protein BMIN_1631 [Bifidobacterium minimum]
MDRVVHVMRVSTVDDEVASIKESSQGIDGFIGRLARWNHNPHNAWGGKPSHQRFHAVHITRGLRAEIEAHDIMPILAKTLDHIPTHST